MSRKINKFVPILTSEIFIIFVLLFLLPTINNKRQVINNHSYDQKLSLENKFYSQKFISTQKYLNSISLNFQNPGLIGHDQIEINLSQNQNQIQKFTTSGYSINDGGWIKFEFPPIIDSQNQEYTISIHCLQKCSNLYLTGQDNSNFNLQTSSKYSLKESFTVNLNNQISKFKNHSFGTILYTILIIILNLLLYITL